MSKKTSKDFFKVLFNEDEATCFTSDPHGINVSLVKSADNNPQFEYFCSNPLHPTKDNDPSRWFHKEDLPRRAYANITVFRNFLFEIDDKDGVQMSAQDQWEFIKSTGLPLSAAVWSGSKSIHFMVSLETPVTTREEYKALWMRIWYALDQVPDKACKDASRLTRYPNGYRRNKEKVQQLIIVNQRIETQTLEDWLKNRPQAPKPKTYSTTAHKKREIPKDFRLANLYPSTRFFLIHGAVDGTWNPELYKATCDLINNGASYETIEAMLTDITGHLDSKDMNTINSAVRAAESQLEKDE